MKTAIQIFLKQTRRSTKRLALQLVLLCAVVAATLLLSLSACGEKQPAHTHTWDTANCTRGELCWSCKETRGEALGHDWTDATCAKAKHCSRCGKTEGSALTHISDGNATCTLCKQALNQVANIDAFGDIDHPHSYDNTPVVYDGVVFEFPLATASGASAITSWPGYPVDYTVSNEAGAQVAAGSWPANPKVFLGQTESGQWIWNETTHTEYIPLGPGTYTVTYHFYDSEISTPEKHEEGDVYLPKGNLKTGRRQFVVK